MDKKKKGLLLSILGILGLIIMTVGVTYAFFNYAKEGTTENSITSGTITFLYTEVSEVGRGIRIQDAYPMSDEIGKVQVGEGKVFDFKITSNTSSSTSIPYEVTARKKNTSTLDENVVKLYLTEVDGNLEEEVLLDNYSNLVQTTRVDSNKYIEKTIYEGTVPANSINYEKNFRLRMWIDEDTDFSPVTDSEGNVTYPYSGKEFTLTVNVYANGKVVTEVEEGHAWNFEYIGEEQTFTAPVAGKYKIELWGAQGGGSTANQGGYGAYTMGLIELKEDSQIYIYVGATTENGTGGYNGGGSNIGSVYGGGGATDIRLVKGQWNDFNSLKSRIMVAAGGGGYGMIYVGGNAGGLVGSEGNGDDPGHGAGQTYGGAAVAISKSDSAGKFGLGGTGSWGDVNPESIGGGGSGYYGGSSGGGDNNNGSGGGGSSFISGHLGCNAISEQSTSDNIIHTNQSIHYSGYSFNETVMIDGNGYLWTDTRGAYVGQPSSILGETQVGQVGNGYAKITYIGD